MFVNEFCLLPCFGKLHATCRQMQYKQRQYTSGNKAKNIVKHFFSVHVNAFNSSTCTLLTTVIVSNNANVKKRK